MSRLLKKATKIASKVHQDQFRKHSGVPYIIHPLEVCKRLTLWGVSQENMLAAAILHDTIEDATEKQHLVAREIADLGGDIYTMVNDLTLYKGQEKAAYLLTFDKKCVRSLVIKIADRVCNLNDFLAFKYDDFTRYYMKSLDLFDIFNNRYTEVENYFGSDTLHKINNDLIPLKHKAYL